MKHWQLKKTLELVKNIYQWQVLKLKNIIDKNIKIYKMKKSNILSIIKEEIDAFFENSDKLYRRKVITNLQLKALEKELDIIVN